MCCILLTNMHITYTYVFARDYNVPPPGQSHRPYCSCINVILHVRVFLWLVSLMKIKIIFGRGDNACKMSKNATFYSNVWNNILLLSRTGAGAIRANLGLHLFCSICVVEFSNEIKLKELRAMYPSDIFLILTLFILTLNDHISFTRKAFVPQWKPDIYNVLSTPGYK